MAPPKAVLTDSANTVRVPMKDISNEIAATSLALLDKIEERTTANKEFNTEIKKLQKRLRELATEVKSAGMRDQFQMNFPAPKPPLETDDDHEN